MRMLLLFIFCTLPNLANSSDIDDLGSISFPTSGDAAAQEHFLRGVATLHSFGWKQAIVEFQAAQKIDPDFALAYWGESLCYNHPLIRERDLNSSKQVLQRLGKTAAARMAKAPTAREKGFLSAVEALFFSDGDTAVRRTRYMGVMRKLYSEYPDDDEIAAFYAVSLLSAAAGDPERRHRMNITAGSIGLELTARNPRHPGAVHYTIHAFDDPIHAPLALPAAYVFDDIAPAVSHARHMPTHIFIQHGMWEEVSASNQSAYDTAVALWQPGDNAGDMTHALDWGQYGDLQLGDYQRAQLWIERMAAILPGNRDQLRIQAALPRVKARYVIESRRWQIKAITEQSADTELFATGISAINLDQLDVAKVAADRLQEKAGQLQSELDPSYYARNGKPVLIMYHQVAGALNIAQGHIDVGIDHLGKGVTVAESMRPPNGAPNPIKPAHEFYAEYLLSSNQAQRAVEMFTTSLSRTPNRPLSLLGLARSYVALGRNDEATAAYRKLAAVWHGKDFPELTEANRFLTASRSP